MVKQRKTSDATAESSDIIVVINWVEERKRLMPTP